MNFRTGALCFVVWLSLSYKQWNPLQNISGTQHQDLPDFISFGKSLIAALDIVAQEAQNPTMIRLGTVQCTSYAKQYCIQVGLQFCSFFFTYM